MVISIHSLGGWLLPIVNSIRSFYGKSIIFLFFFLSYPSYSYESLHYWIRSHRWYDIENYFKNQKPSKESEVYSLIEFYEKSHNPNPEKRFLYLISQVKGSFVQNFNYSDIETILQNPLPYQSIVYRLSYWKLYEEMEKRKLWKAKDKIVYLDKLIKDLDPVSRRVMEELGSLYLEENQPQLFVNQIEKLPSDVRSYYLSRELKLRYAQALYRSGNLDKSLQEYKELANREDTLDYLKAFIYQDLKKNLPIDAFLNLHPSIIAPIINQLSKEEASKWISKNKSILSSELESLEAFKQLGLYLAKNNELNNLIHLVNHNTKYLESDTELLGLFGMEFYYNNQYSQSIQFLESFPKFHHASKYRVLAISYKKLNQNDKYFQNLVEYLSLYPFNLHYHDMLIEFLKNSNQKLNSLEYWQKALESIPNLPVKGRLYYWYFRYLKQSGNIELLKKELEYYYEKIAGSYYTRVIREEFKKELDSLPVPSNPLENKKALYRYLSHTAGIPMESKILLKRNLGFAYLDKSFDLGIRLSQVQTKIRGDRILSLATDYFRLGEDSYGMSLIHDYARAKGLSIQEKEEILVGVGDLSKATYYSAFYTRSLLKRLRISDDPILLPTSISSRLYPRPHRDIVQKYSNESGINEETIYAVMRQESFYKENAISRSNARGLMQIMPSTGKELANRLGVSSYSLFNPDTSIRFGALFLSYLIRANDNELRWAAIAYNGGPGNLRKWKKNYYKGDFNHFLEEIPYKESRDYARIVMSNYYSYEALKYFHGL